MTPLDEISAASAKMIEENLDYKFILKVCLKAKTDPKIKEALGLWVKAKDETERLNIIKDLEELIK